MVQKENKEDDRFLLDTLYGWIEVYLIKTTPNSHRLDVSIPLK